MQFDRQAEPHRLSNVPQDSFLPHNRLGSIQEKKGKWAKTNGRWHIASKNDSVKPSPDVIKVKKVEKAEKPIVEKTRKTEKPKKPVVPIEDVIERKYFRSYETIRNKVYLKPLNNDHTNYRATEIQRVMRGWWQRLHFRIALLEHKRDHGAEEDIRHIQDKLQRKKEKYLAKMKAKAQANSDKVTLEALAAQESKEIIAYLRKENKSMRAANEKLAIKIREIRKENEKLEATSRVIADSFQELQNHAAYLQDTHDKIQDVIPQYRESIEQLETALELRQTYCVAEKKVRVNYVNCVGNVVEVVSDNCKDQDLIDEVVGYCMNMEAGSDE